MPVLFPPDPLAPDFTFCGEPEPTEECEFGGWCDYHAGITPPPTRGEEAAE